MGKGDKAVPIAARISPCKAMANKSIPKLKQKSIKDCLPPEVMRKATAKDPAIVFEAGPKFSQAIKLVGAAKKAGWMKHHPYTIDQADFIEDVRDFCAFHAKAKPAGASCLMGVNTVTNSAVLLAAGLTVPALAKAKVPPPLRMLHITPSRGTLDVQPLPVPMPVRRPGQVV
mmetsp:Transcript_62212/g.115460  ORF Transcript_62212/g.115460 Transcript_62212/m.115460 type:complete len:172 (+) Transcript_62212:72-587(+)